MHIRATISGKQLGTAIAVPESVWKALGTELVSRIITRTALRHLDADGVAFAPYSDGYAALKAKAGATTAVTLRGIGAKVPGRSFVPGKNRMLDDIVFTTRASDNPRLVLFFRNADKEVLAQYHMKEGRVLRKFFALSDDDIDFGVTLVRNRLKQTTP